MTAACVVTLAATVFVLVPVASADPATGQSLTVDIIGDSYTAGEGVRDSYLDPADQRHRSLAAPALQALSRLANDNPGLRVDANVVASSGAVIADYFANQKGPDGRGGERVVNAAQHHQVRPDTQLVIVGFGGNDTQFAQVLAAIGQASGAPDGSLEIRIRNLAALLDSTGSDEEYLRQAMDFPPGQAPTLIARMLQVLAGVDGRAPNAGIVVTNYPLAVDPQNKHAASLVGERDLTTVRKFAHDLNAAIERAVRICRCATLVDVSGALSGHEAYTGDSAFNERPSQPAQQELFHPNHKGASLMANPIATGIARVLRVTAPAPSDGKVTVPRNIQIRGGVPDRDGDTVPDHFDRSPDNPPRATEKTEPTVNRPADSRAKPGPRSKSSTSRRHSPGNAKFRGPSAPPKATPPASGGAPAPEANPAATGAAPATGASLLPEAGQRPRGAAPGADGQVPAQAKQRRSGTAPVVSGQDPAVERTGPRPARQWSDRLRVDRPALDQGEPTRRVRAATDRKALPGRVAPAPKRTKPAPDRDSGAHPARLEPHRPEVAGDRKDARRLWSRWKRMPVVPDQTETPTAGKDAR